MEKKTNGRMVLITAVLLILIGAVLLFVPQIQLQHISYFMCGVIVVGGVYSIVRYFMSNAFREASDYGFSIGVFLCVVGIAGFMKTREIVAFFPVVISMICLLFGVILLQDALDLKRLLSVIWIPVLTLSAVVILTSMVVMVDPFSEASMRQEVSNWLMFGTGIMVLISKLTLTSSYKGFERREKKQQEKIEKLARGAESIEKPEEDNTLGAEPVSDPNGTGTQQDVLEDTQKAIPEAGEQQEEA